TRRAPCRLGVEVRGDVVDLKSHSRPPCCNGGFWRGGPSCQARPQEEVMTDQPTPEKILQTGLAFWASKTLLSAVEMGLFTELAHGPEPFESVCGRLSLHPRSARDFLDALVALGFLQRTGD